MKNPECPERYKQFMILFSTKNHDKVMINDFLWHRKKGFEFDGEKLTFNGMIAAWYYDGNKMIEPFILEERDFEVREKVPGKSNEGELKTVSQPQDILTFSGNPEKYRLVIKKKAEKGKRAIDIDLTMTSVGRLSEPRYNENTYYKSLGYNILKIRKMDLSGYFRTGQEAEKGKKRGKGNSKGNGKVEGTAYFQKVMVNAPAVPWYWGTFHIKDGSYIQYFMPHVGLGIFRRCDKESFLERRGKKFVSKSLEFYDAHENKRHIFKDIRILRHLNDDKFPVFTVLGKNETSTLKIVADCYSKACWRFQQRFPLINPVFYYGEYPAILKLLEFNDAGKITTLEDYGAGIGNCEHSWGFLF